MPRDRRALTAVFSLVALVFAWLVWPASDRPRSARPRVAMPSAPALPEARVPSGLVSEVTLIEGGGESPRWSMDGEWLAMSGGSSYVPRIRTARVRGRSPIETTELPHPEGSASEPTWTPSGRLVYVLTQPGTGWYDPDVASLRTAWPDGAGRSGPRTTAIHPVGATRLSDLAASPDEGVVAFIGDGDLWIWEVDHIGPIARTVATEGAPSFSPDGTRIAFDRAAIDNEDAWNDGNILVYDLNTGRERIVADGPLDQLRPVWVTNDAVAWFETPPRHSWDLVVRDRDGVRTLARDVVLPSRGSAAVIPHTPWVAWVRRAGNQGDVYLANVESGDEVVVPTGLAVALDPALTLRGGRVLLAVSGRLEGDTLLRWTPPHLIVLDITDEVFGE